MTLRWSSNIISDVTAVPRHTHSASASRSRQRLNLSFFHDLWFPKSLTNLTQIHVVFNFNTNVTKEPVTDLNSQDSQRTCNNFNSNIGVRTSLERNILQLHLDRDPLGRVVTKHAHNRSQVCNQIRIPSVTHKRVQSMFPVENRVNLSKICERFWRLQLWKKT